MAQRNNLAPRVPFASHGPEPLLNRPWPGRNVSVSSLFNLMDADKSNSVTASEFQSGLAMGGIRPLPTVEAMKELFKEIDTDNSGSLSWEELHEVPRGAQGARVCWT